MVNIERLFHSPLPRGIIISILLLLQLPLHAQKYSNDFLSIGIGAEAQGLSGAFVARTRGHSAGYWNPAGLIFTEAPFQVGVMHAEWFAGIAKYDYLGIAKTLDDRGRSALGVSIIRLGIDQIPNTLRLMEPDGTLNFDNLSEFSAADYALLLSYSRRLHRRASRTLAIGGNAKVIHRSIGTFATAWGFGLDAGLQYHWGQWQAGCMFRDVSFTFNAWNFSLTEEEKAVFRQTGNVIPSSTLERTPPRAILGLARDWSLGEKWRIAAEIDAIITTDGQRNVLISGDWLNVDPAAGVSVDYNERVTLRAGVGNFQQIQDELDPSQQNWSAQPSIGLGIQLGAFRLDYALTDPGDFSETLYSHIFSLQLDIDPEEQGTQLGD